MLDELECHHQIERAIRRGYLQARSALESHILTLVIPARIIDGIAGNVDSKNLARIAGQHARAIARPAPGVEHPPPMRHPRSEPVARHVLVPEIGIDLARNHTFAREFSQASS